MNYTDAESCICPANDVGGICPVGYFCPAGTDNPKPCTGGYYCKDPRKATLLLLLVAGFG